MALNELMEERLQQHLTELHADKDKIVNVTYLVDEVLTQIHGKGISGPAEGEDEGILATERAALQQKIDDLTSEVEKLREQQQCTADAVKDLSNADLGRLQDGALKTFEEIQSLDTKVDGLKRQVDEQQVLFEGNLHRAEETGHRVNVVNQDMHALEGMMANVRATLEQLQGDFERIKVAAQGDMESLRSAGEVQERLKEESARVQEGTEKVERLLAEIKTYRDFGKVLEDAEHLKAAVEEQNERALGNMDGLRRLMVEANGTLAAGAGYEELVHDARGLMEETHNKYKEIKAMIEDIAGLRSDVSYLQHKMANLSTSGGESGSDVVLKGQVEALEDKFSSYQHMTDNLSRVVDGHQVKLNAVISEAVSRATAAVVAKQQEEGAGGPSSEVVKEQVLSWVREHFPVEAGQIPTLEDISHMVGNVVMYDSKYFFFVLSCVPCLR